MLSNAPQQQMSLFQTYYVQYPPSLSSQIFSIFNSIQSTYAAFHWFCLREDLGKLIAHHYYQIKLTKRKKTFAVLIPQSPTDNPELLPQGSKRIIITDEFLKIPREDTIFISERTILEDVQTELIKLFQLDSVWVGLLCRIGTDIEELQQYLVSHEHFDHFQVPLLNDFYILLDKQLRHGVPLSEGLLNSCKKEVEVALKDYNSKIEDLVRSKFNCRTLIKGITNHPFTSLLESRSYFNLIFIEGQILHRFNTFKQQTLHKYPHIHQMLTLQNFIMLDDYIYSQFIFGCLKKVKKYINRTLEREPYSQIVQRHHKDFIRQFRPSLHEQFLSICLVLKRRSACIKEAVGSIIVKNRNIISTGYNGTPMSTINCYNGGCQVCNNSEKMGTEVLSCRCLHAEYNCILTAGITQTPGATLYSSKLPCLWCAKLIIQGRINEVIYIRSKYDSLEHENSQLVKKTFAAGKVFLREMQISFSD